MKTCIQFILCLLLTVNIYAQRLKFKAIKINATTAVKDQLKSSTCWDFAGTAMIESELLKKNKSKPDLSEAFIMYNTYIDKATKYLGSKGRTMFAKGGIAEDMLNATDVYGAMPEQVYPGTGRNKILNRENEMFPELKSYLDSIIANNPNPGLPGWQDNFEKILAQHLGSPPGAFIFKRKSYTPKSFASAFIESSSSDFIGLTSFTHHPFYAPFVIEVSHNYNNNVYNNLPLDEFISTVKACIQNGYTLIWDTDITNYGFQKNKGFAMWATSKADSKALPDFEEPSYTSEIRQDLFKKGTTQNNHLMLITGLVKNADGKEYFVVKNSWGKLGPLHGYLYVSIPYFAINTISVLVNKKALPGDIANKLDNKNEPLQAEVINKIIIPVHESSMATESLPSDKYR